MISLQFSEQDIADIDEACDDPELPGKIKRKLMCLKMHHQKVTNLAITRILNMNGVRVLGLTFQFPAFGEDSLHQHAVDVGEAGSTVLASDG